MRKILNDAERYVDEMIGALVGAFPEDFAVPPDGSRSLVRPGAGSGGKVALATGGGSGHFPLFLGYVGDGLLDGVAIGDVFSSPSPDEMLAVIRATHSGAGALLIYGNYTGDVFNFDMAAELAADEGIEVRSLAVADDVASAPPERAAERRGVAGMVLVYKIAGAAAAGGASLDEVEAVARAAATSVRSLGVALSATTIPSVGKPGFDVPDGEMELGMGIHGERGTRRTELTSARQIANDLVTAILEDFPEAPDEVAVLVNTLGATAGEEGLILTGDVVRELRERGVRVARQYVGEYATSMEMAGASVSVLPLDDRMRSLLAQPAYSPVLPAHFGGGR